jgi:hypothetical protein
MTDPARPVQAMLEEEDLKDAILLVFANKQDMKGACDPASCGRAGWWTRATLDAGTL